MQSQLPAMVLSEAEEAGIQQCTILSTLSFWAINNVLTSLPVGYVSIRPLQVLFSVLSTLLGWIALILSSASISIHLWI